MLTDNHSSPKVPIRHILSMSTTPLSSAPAAEPIQRCSAWLVWGVASLEREKSHGRITARRVGPLPARRRALST